MFALVQLHGPQGFVHAVARDHALGNLGHPFQVVLRPGRDVLEHKLLGGAPAQQGRQLCLEVRDAEQVLLLVGKRHDVAQRLSAADDGNLADIVGKIQQGHHDGVTGFVVGHVAALLLRDDPALAGGAGHDPFDGFHQVLHGDGVLILAGGQDGGLVHQVFQIRPRQARGLGGNGLQVRVLRERLAARVDIENGVPFVPLGQVDHHLAVETAGSEQGRVQDVGSIGGGNDDHVGAAFEPVHLHQDLVEGLLPFVVAASHAGAPVSADGVNLVDEDDAGSLFLGLLEKVPDPAGADAHEHFHKLGAGTGEERHAGLAGHRLGQQGLAGAGRSHHQDALGDAGPQFLELGRFVQELHHFLQLLLGLDQAGRVVEGDVGVVLRFDLLGAAPAELQRTVGAGPALAHDEQEKAQDDQHGQDDEEPAQNGREPGRIAEGDVQGVEGLGIHPEVGQTVVDAGLHLLAGAQHVVVVEAHRDGVALDINAGQPARTRQFRHAVEANRVVAGRVEDQEPHGHHAHDDQQDPDPSLGQEIGPFLRGTVAGAGAAFRVVGHKVGMIKALDGSA